MQREELPRKKKTNLDFKLGKILLPLNCLPSFEKDVTQKTENLPFLRPVGKWFPLG